MKKLFVLTLATMLLCVPVAATRRALVIGIGAYPAGSGWKAINGDKDVPVVTSMLLKNGFSANNITTLKNEQATYARIYQEIQNLAKVAQPKDFIYIHFSGHGQQITDVHGDEEDGLDEAWIPYDAGFAYQKGKYEGQNHLLDDQLCMWLNQIRDKVGDDGKIIVVADACHSGGSTRAINDEEEEEWVARGTQDAFIIPNPTTVNLPFSAQMVRWVLISACKSYQTNFEYKGTGSLTYALNALNGEFSSLTCKQIIKKVGSTIREIIPYTQSPQMDCPMEQSEEMFF